MIRLFDTRSIYKITNPTGSIYIGQTKDTVKRFQYYRSGQCKCQQKICNSIKKYGWENHIVEILETIHEDLISEREIYWVSFYKCNYRRHPKVNGLNLTDGGETNMGKCIRRVYEYTIVGDFVREWDSQIEAVKFYHIAQNHIFQVCSGKQKTCAKRRWSYTKEEFLEPIRERRKGTKYFDIYQLDCKTGSIIRLWNNIGEIVRDMDLQYIGITNCFTGRLKTYKGYKWILKENYHGEVV